MAIKGYRKSEMIDRGGFFGRASLLTILSLPFLFSSAFSQDLTGQNVEHSNKQLTVSLQQIDSELAKEEEALLKELAKSHPNTKAQRNISGRTKKEPTSIATERSPTAAVQTITSQVGSQYNDIEAPNVRSLEQKLNQQRRELGAMQTSREKLEQKVNSSEKRIKELMSQLHKTRQELLLAETEVERLSRLIEDRNSSRVRNLRAPSNSQPPRASFNSIRSSKPKTQQRPKHQRTEEPTGALAIATVTVPKANLRTGPGLNNSVLLTVGQASQLVVEKREGDWFRVIAPTGERAWVSSSVVKFR